MHGKYSTLLIFCCALLMGVGIVYSVFPFDEAWGAGIMLFLLIAIGIGAPYFMLKFGASEARKYKPLGDEDKKNHPVPEHRVKVGE